MLDNDTDVAGSVLSIDQADVARPSIGGVATTVSADGQAIHVTVPEKTAGSSFTFDYPVNNGKVKGKGEAKVTVRVVADSVNGAPEPAPGRGKLADAGLPRDRRQAPVACRSSPTGATPRTTSSPRRRRPRAAVVDGAGPLTLTAPQKVGKQRSPTSSPTGAAARPRATVAAHVIGTTDSKFVAPRTQPDAVRGVVGKPLQIEPLGNDIAGADPGEPDARLRLARRCAPVGPLDVDTDLVTGRLTVTGSAPGTYELTYSAQTGAGVSAGPGAGRPRRAARGRCRRSPCPTPRPCTTRRPVMVDVARQRLQPARRRARHAAVSTDGGDAGCSRPSTRAAGCASRPATRAPSAPARARRGVVKLHGQRRHPAHHRPGRRAAAGPARGLGAARRRTTPRPCARATPCRCRCSTTTRWPTASRSSSTRRSVKVVSKGDASGPSPPATSCATCPEARGLRGRAVRHHRVRRLRRRDEGPRPDRAGCGCTVNAAADRRSGSTSHRSPAASRRRVTAGDPITMTVPTFGVDPDGDSVSVTGIVGADGGPSTSPAAGSSPSGRRRSATRPIPLRRRHRGHQLRGARPVRRDEPGVRAGRRRAAGRPAAAGGRRRRGVRGAGQDGHRQAAAERPHRPRRRRSTSTSSSLNDAADPKLWQRRRRTTPSPRRCPPTPRGCTSSSTASATACSTPRARRSWSVRSRTTSTPPVARDDVARPSRARPRPSSTPSPTTRDIDSDPATLPIVEVSPHGDGRERPGAGDDPRPPVCRAVRHRGRGRRRARWR